MAKLLAIDWDQLEARFVVARAKGSGISVDKTVAVPINLSVQQGGDSAHEQVAEQLGAALQSAGVPKCQAITAVGRSMIELGTLSLPPAPVDELPEMVRFQAMREFGSLQENSPLDFVPLKDAGTESGQVIAAAIPAGLSSSIESAITRQGSEPHRSVMRPFAFAALAMRQRPQLRTGVAMIISQQSDSAELAVVKNGLVVFSRSFRLPPDWLPGESGEPLLGEVRRSLAAAQNQLGQSRVQHIALFGDTEHAGLCERLRERTKLEVELLDPFEGVALNAAPEHRERFAAAIGSLLDEANGEAPVIDFRNPRKKPEVESQTGRRLLYGGAIAAVLLGLAALLMWKFQQLDGEVARKSRSLASIKNKTKNLQPTVELAKDLKKWKQSDRDWLGELTHLSSVEGLTADDFRLESIQGRTLSRDTKLGVLDIQGRSRDLQAQKELHQGLEDEMHIVEPTGGGPLRDNDDIYDRLFKTTIYTKQSIAVVSQAPVPNGQPSAAGGSQPADEAEKAPAPRTEDAKAIEKQANEKQPKEETE